MIENNFGLYIRNTRLKHDLSFRRFCKLLEVNPQQWYRVEQNYLKPTNSELQKIVCILGEKIEDLQYLVDNTLYLTEPEKYVSCLPIFPHTRNKEDLENLIKDLGVK